MKSLYEEIRLKNIFYKFLFVITSITFSIIIAFTILFLIVPIFKNKEIIPVNVYIFGTELSNKVQEEINNAISMGIENIYNRLLANIQFSIALFSSALVIFAIVFGVIYFSKIRDAENLIREIQKTPGLFFKQFYREQFDKSVSSLFSPDYIKRNDAINKLSFNPEIDNNDYDLLQEVLYNELSYDLQVYYYQNISTIMNILLKINHKKTISLLCKILQEQKYDQTKHSNLLNYIVADNSDKTVKYIKDNLLNSSELSTPFISSLAVNRLLNNYLDYIFEKCPSPILQVAINLSRSDEWHKKPDTILSLLYKREDTDSNILQYYIIPHETIDTKEKIAMVLYFYAKDKEKFKDSLSSLINRIQSNENAKKEFLSLAEEDKYKELVAEYFTKNSYQRTFFNNYQDSTIIEQALKKTEIKTISDVVKENGLCLSEDGAIVTDKNGFKYDVQLYSRSFPLPMWQPVKTGILIDRVFIDIDELKKNQEL